MPRNSLKAIIRNLPSNSMKYQESMFVHPLSKEGVNSTMLLLPVCCPSHQWLLTSHVLHRQRSLWHKKCVKCFIFWTYHSCQNELFMHHNSIWTNHLFLAAWAPIIFIILLSFLCSPIIGRLCSSSLLSPFLLINLALDFVKGEVPPAPHFH